MELARPARRRLRAACRLGWESGVRSAVPADEDPAGGVCPAPDEFEADLYFHTCLSAVPSVRR